MNSLPPVRKMPLLVHGMHGMGDNIHQRAIMRELMKRKEVWLETPWPCLYHDLVGPDLKLITKGSTLRTQAKNAAREAAKFTRLRPPSGTPQLSISYSPDAVRSHGSVLAAMCATAKVQQGDFRLPVASDWAERANALISQWGVAGRPIMVYRPLVERTEWGGCRSRNPDHHAYARLFRSIRDQFFVVSVADLQLQKEWQVGEPVDADVSLHAGELPSEVLAALIGRASLVYASPGFAIVMAQAVGTPSICVFGGYENSKSFLGGAAFAPYLGIDPINSCNCFSHTHKCDKQIDVKTATIAIQEFVNATKSKVNQDHPALV